MAGSENGFIFTIPNGHICSSSQPIIPFGMLDKSITIQASDITLRQLNPCGKFGKSPAFNGTGFSRKMASINRVCMFHCTQSFIKHLSTSFCHGSAASNRRELSIAHLLSLTTLPPSMAQTWPAISGIPWPSDMVKPRNWQKTGWRSGGMAVMSPCSIPVKIYV